MVGSTDWWEVGSTDWWEVGFQNKREVGLVEGGLSDTVRSGRLPLQLLGDRRLRHLPHILH